MAPALPRVGLPFARSVRWIRSAFVDALWDVILCAERFLSFCLVDPLRLLAPSAIKHATLRVIATVVASHEVRADTVIGAALEAAGAFGIMVAVTVSLPDVGAPISFPQALFDRLHDIFHLGVLIPDDVLVLELFATPLRQRTSEVVRLFHIGGVGCPFLGVAKITAAFVTRGNLVQGALQGIRGVCQSCRAQDHQGSTVCHGCACHQGASG
mmetsp:Transcript_59388/g.193781  ORF Transcript_59388/g.193781 Transcript_59388/m.193781 type:complete len:212 (-) Transcript_59388:32-667(-)